MKGTIFNIEEFAVHDGPGIRKLVFFKGCPLHCTWCHNPEGISLKKELMVSYAACTHCGNCSSVCEHDKCVACGACVVVCPLRLRKIVGQEIEAKELAVILLKGEEVLNNSGGGITISGGEPLAQPDFLFDLIKYLKPIHIAVETSGHAKSKVFKKMVSEVDLVMMDVKHTDSETHRKFTSVGNEQILKNLEFLCNSETDFYIRIPLIPGINDMQKNMENIVSLLKGAKHLVKVELLPYHKTAGAKYPMVNKVFNPGFDTSIQMNIHTRVFEENNINVIVL